MLLDKELEFPLYISVNLLVVSPQKIQVNSLPAEDTVVGAAQQSSAAAASTTRPTPISNIGSSSSSTSTAAGGAISGPSSIGLGGNEVAAAAVSS